MSDKLTYEVYKLIQRQKAIHVFNGSLCCVSAASICIELSSDGISYANQILTIRDIVVHLYESKHALRVKVDRHNWNDNVQIIVDDKLDPVIAIKLTQLEQEFRNNEIMEIPKIERTLQV